MTAVEDPVVDDAATDSHRRWWRRPLSARSITLVALTMILLAAGIRSYWIFNSWFLIDDFLFTSDIARGIDDVSWYMRIHQGHFMPLSFGLVKLVTVVGAPFVWTAAATEILVLQLLASLTCWWMLHTLFGPRPALLAGLAFYLFAPLTMPSIMWWAVAINQLPHEVAFFGAIATHVKYCRTRRRRWMIVTSAFLVVGYLSYAKSGLIVVVLAAITILWFSFGPPWARFWYAVRTYISGWIAYGIISAVWLATYLHQAPTTVPVKPSGFLPLAQAMVWQNFIPAVTGGPWRWTVFGKGPISYTLPPLLLLIAGALLVAAVVGYAWATRNRSLQILWVLGIYIFASALLVYTGRSYQFQFLGGGQVGRHLQYVSDVAPLVVLAGVALFVPIVDALDPISRRTSPMVRWTPPQWLIVIGATIVVASSLYTSHLYAKPWRSFSDEVLTKRAIAEIRSEKPIFVDVGVPDTILSPVFGERSLIKNYFAPLGPVVRTALAGTDMKVFTLDATLAEAGVRDPTSPRPIADEPVVGKCLDVSTDGRWTTVAAPPAFGLWLQVDYRAALPERFGTPARSKWAPESPGSISVQFGDTRQQFPALPGEHTILVAAPEPASTVVMRSTDGIDVCVTSIRYGQVAPRVAPS